MGILGGFVSGHRFSDAVNCPPFIAPSGVGRRIRSSLVVILLVLLSSTYTLADTGADIYKARCSACHGARGAGDTMIGKNLKLRALVLDDVQQQSDDELATIISKGKNKMPAYGGRLSKDQIRDLVRHIRSLKK
jgi:cytochrome c6